MKLLLVGDSLVEFHDWQASLPGHAVTNAGMAGETVAGLLARLPSILPQPPEHEVVAMMIGANNLVMEDYFFLEEYQAILDTIADLAPGSRVIVTGLPPFALPWLADSAIPRLNQALVSMAGRNNAEFLDLHAAFDTGCHPGTACFEHDGVHLSATGYALWADRMQDLLEHH